MKLNHIAFPSAPRLAKRIGTGLLAPFSHLALSPFDCPGNISKVSLSLCIFLMRVQTLNPDDVRVCSVRCMWRRRMRPVGICSKQARRLHHAGLESKCQSAMRRCSTQLRCLLQSPEACTSYDVNSERTNAGKAGCSGSLTHHGQRLHALHGAETSSVSYHTVHCQQECHLRSRGKGCILSVLLSHLAIIEALESSKISSYSSSHTNQMI